MKIIKIFSLLFSQSISLILNLTVQIILAHYYSTKDTGVYLSLFALTNILSTIGLFGINKYYIYIKSKSNVLSYEHIKVIAQLFISINFICMIFLIIWGYLHFPQYPLFIISNSLLIFLTSIIAILTSVVQIKNQINIISIFQVLIPIIKVSGLLLGCYIFNEVFNGYSFVVITLSLLSIYFLYKIYIKNYRLKLKEIKGDYYHTLKILAPYAFLNIFFTIYTQGNTFYIGILESPEKAAYFAIAYLFINTVFIFPTAVYQKVLAHRLLKLIYSDMKRFKNIYTNLQELIILLSSFFIFVMYLLSDVIITILFGDKYYESVLVLKILLLVVPFRLISISIGTILSNNENIKKRIMAELILCIINIGMNFTMIPLLGIDGAVISVIITELLLSVFFTFIVERTYLVKINRFSYLAFIPLFILIIFNFNIISLVLVEIFMILITFKPIIRRINFLWKNI
ncbi:oligosaccharide flippase family protein [Mammaliicoccus sciuri]|uniref:oligosaccharide flippase family protein n=1 Tax=Mammaliicoccus sciuri TaxID=1296 RepID=UPI003F56C5CD